MYDLPNKLKKLVPYEPLTGNYQIRLDANESFLSVPAALRREIADAVVSLDFNRYPDPYCVELCKRFGSYFNVDSDLVVAGNGSDELIGLIISSFADKGETMAVVSPDFSMYAFYAQTGGTRVVTYEKDPDSLSIDPDALIACARENRAKILMFSNPCNPTSQIASREDVIKIVEGLKDCLVVVDEAYMDFADESILALAGKYENLLLLKTCSKAFGMAAIRLGFAIGSKPVINAIKAVKSPYNVNSMTQAVGCMLLGHKEYLDECARKIRKSRDMLYNMLAPLEQRKAEVQSVYNTCANFVLLRMRDAKAVFLTLQERGIAIRQLGGFLRITAGTDAENNAVVKALDDILQ